MKKKTIASISVILLFLLQLFRYNLEFIGLSSDISMFDLFGDVCWILAFVLLILNQKSRFLISMYIFLISGALGCVYEEILKMSTSYSSSDYLFLVIGLVSVGSYNLLISPKITEVK